MLRWNLGKCGIQDKKALRFIAVRRACDSRQFEERIEDKVKVIKLAKILDRELNNIMYVLMKLAFILIILSFCK